MDADNSVPLSHGIGLGQRDKPIQGRDKGRDSGGTASLKDLARKVLSRDTGWDNSGTSALSTCPTTKSALGQENPSVPGQNQEATQAPPGASQASPDPPRSHHPSAPVSASPPTPQAGWGVEQWRAYLRFWTTVRLRDGTRDRAETFAWSAAQCEWNRLHPLPALAAGLCAGCGGSMTEPGLGGWPDAPEVHDLRCLVRYGWRWRYAATMGLILLGLKVPAITPESEMTAASKPAESLTARMR